MRITLIGCGDVGYAFAYALAEERTDVELRVVDESYPRAVKCSSLPLPSTEFIVVNLSQEADIARVLKGSDIIVNTVSQSFISKVLKLATQMCIDVISAAPIPESALALDNQFRACKSVLIPDTGFVPGLSNLIVGRILAIHDAIDEIGIYAGVLPLSDRDSLSQIFIQSPSNIVEEYSSQVRIIEDGNVKSVDPLAVTDIIDIPGVGRFEATYGEGLGTLLYTLRGKVKRAFKKTIWYAGHVEALKVLRELGLFSAKPLDINGAKVSPRDFLLRLLKLRERRDVPDMTVLYIKAIGSIDKRRRVIQYLIQSVYDSQRKLSARSKIAGFTAYAILRLKISDRLRDFVGVVPPEVIGMRESLFTEVISWLVLKGVYLDVKGEFLNHR
ncbi:MAG TPA: hypothetical protein EYP48_00555 [Ignisphaera sp.]|nr:hypothetical protein [Ignisphaera sp.]